MEKKKSVEYKFGNWTKDISITKDWTPADYFINNQEVYIEKSDLEPLTPYTTRSTLMIKYVLYGLFDLYKDTGRTSFRQIDILKQIGEEVDGAYKNSKKYMIKAKYKALINLKVQNIIENKNIKKFNRTNNNYDVDAKIKKEILNNIKVISKINQITRPDFNLAVNLLRANFIKVTYAKKDQDYLDEIGISEKSPTPFYSLKKEGKKLMEKFQKEGFLI